MTRATTGSGPIAPVPSPDLVVSTDLTFGPALATGGHQVRRGGSVVPAGSAVDPCGRGTSGSAGATSGVCGEDASADPTRCR